MEWPAAVAVDAQGDLFIADTDNPRVREVIAATGIITTGAGTGTYGYSGDGGPATQAQLSYPDSVAVDAQGDLFIADSGNDVVREVLASTGVITTVVGTGVTGYGGDGGPATQAQLSYPTDMIADRSGNLFIADCYNDVIREVLATTLTYDPAHPGDVIAQTDANGHTSHYTYDAYGNLTSASDPLGETTSYSYDLIGRKAAMVDPRGNVAGANPISYTTTMTADAFGQTTAITDPLGRVTTYQYDPDGNVITTTDPLGHQTIERYDAANERIAVRRPDGRLLRTGYDPDGNVITQTDGLGGVTTDTYDALNRLVAVTDPLGRTTVYTYDADQELTGLGYSDGSTPSVAFTYTATGQRAGMSDGTGMSTYTYDALRSLAPLWPSCSSTQVNARR